MRRYSRARLIAVVLAVAALGIAGCSASSLSALINKKTHKSHSQQHSKHHSKGHRKGHAKRHPKAHHHKQARAHHPAHHRHHAAAGGPDSLVVEPSGGFSSVYQLINHARHSIDVTMFEFADPTAEHDLGAAAKRGVDVRVILDQREHTTNTDAYDYFKSHGIKVVWSSTKFEYTHQKTLTFDNSVSMVQTANLTQRYYATSRDFLVKDTNPADIAAIVKVFNADFAHQPITAGDGHDLVWSPTDSEKQILSVINGAKKNLRIYSEEMGFSTAIDAIEAAAKRGVDVQVCGENSVQRVHPDVRGDDARRRPRFVLQLIDRVLHPRQGGPGRLRHQPRAGVHRLGEFLQHLAQSQPGTRRRPHRTRRASNRPARSHRPAPADVILPRRPMPRPAQPASPALRGANQRELRIRGRRLGDRQAQLCFTTLTPCTSATIL